MTEAEDVIEIRRKGALVRIEHSIEVREEQNLAERIQPDSVRGTKGR